MAIFAKLCWVLECPSTSLYQMVSYQVKNKKPKPTTCMHGFKKISDLNFHGEFPYPNALKTWNSQYFSANLKENIHVDPGANTNLLKLHCYRVPHWFFTDLIPCEWSPLNQPPFDRNILEGFPINELKRIWGKEIRSVHAIGLLC